MIFICEIYDDACSSSGSGESNYSISVSNETYGSRSNGNYFSFGNDINYSNSHSETDYRNFSRSRNVRTSRRRY